MAHQAAQSERPPGFLRLARAPFIAASVLPGILGIVLARHLVGIFHWWRAVLTLLGVAAAHAAANLLNDYFDYASGADQINRFRTPLSGGSPFLVEGQVAPRRVLGTAFACGLVAVACWIALAWMVDGGWGPVSWLAMAGAVLGVLYTAPPVRLAYRSLGELAIFLAFGPLLVSGSYYVQAQGLAVLPLVVSFFPGFLVAAIILINEIPDLPADREADKRTVPVHLGAGTGLRLYAVVNLAAILVACVLMCWLRRPLVLAAVIGPLISLSSLVVCVRRGPTERGVFPVQVATIVGFNAGMLALILALL